MKHLLALVTSLCVLVLIACTPEGKKKCMEGQVLVKGSCVAQEQKNEVVLPTPTPVPTVVPTTPPKLSCGPIPHNGTESRIAYSAAIVPYGQVCSSIQQNQTRICNNGVFSAWSGTFTNLTCSVAAASSCGSIVSGSYEIRTMYQAAAVNEGSSCVSQIQNRLCTNGQLGSWSGSYTQSKCVISRIRYENATAPSGGVCNPEIQTMTCENAVCGAWIPNRYLNIA